MEIVDLHRIDIMILDMAMPEIDGFELLDHLQKNRSKNFKVIAFTFYEDVVVVNRLLRLGVDGFLTKGSPAELIKGAFKEVLDGKFFLPSEFNDKVMRLMRPFQSSVSTFSEREKDIIRCIAEGKTSKEIASQLGYTKRTVETKRTRIEKKVSARNAAELISIAYRTGILKI